MGGPAWTPPDHRGLQHELQLEPPGLASGGRTTVTVVFFGWLGSRQAEKAPIVKVSGQVWQIVVDERSEARDAAPMVAVATAAAGIHPHCCPIEKPT
jgi:hypothetical protein